MSDQQSSSENKEVADKERVAEAAKQYNEREDTSKNDLWEQVMKFCEDPKVVAVLTGLDFLPIGYTPGDLYALLKGGENVLKGVTQGDWARVGKGALEATAALIPDLPFSPVIVQALEHMIPNKEDQQGNANATQTQEGQPEDVINQQKANG